jgi:hypothetical protein
MVYLECIYLGNPRWSLLNYKFVYISAFCNPNVSGMFELLYFDVRGLEQGGPVGTVRNLRVVRLEQRGAASIPALCSSFWSESARRPGG